MIVWREKMSVGHQVIDADHRYLLCLINSVELALRTQESLDELLEQLVDYAQFHFKREEQIQTEVHYPDVERHRGEHRKLAAQLSDAVSRLRQHAKAALRADTGEGTKPAQAAAPGEADKAGAHVRPEANEEPAQPRAPHDADVEAVFINLLALADRAHPAAGHGVQAVHGQTPRGVRRLRRHGRRAIACDARQGAAGLGPCRSWRRFDRRTWPHRSRSGFGQRATGCRRACL